MEISNEVIERVVSRIVQTTLANPADWFVEALSGGNRSESGISVTRNSSLTYSSVWAATSIISSDVASLPLNDTSIESDGDERTNRGSAAQYLLNAETSTRPGMALMSSMSFRETLTAHALLGGNGYAAILRDNSGVAVDLIPLIPDRTYPVLVDNMVVYHCEFFDDVQQMVSATLLPSEVIHIKGLGYDGIRGYSVVTMARNSFGLGMSQQRHGNRHFKNDARPRVVLKVPGKLNKEQAEMLVGTWNANQGGENQGGTAVASGGMEVDTIPISNEDSQWLESRSFQKVEVAQWFQLPPHKLGDTEKLSYKSIEAENRAYLNQTLRKWLCRWEGEAFRKLVPQRDRRSMRRKFKHDVSQLTAADFETKATVATQLRGSLVIDGNEARQMVGFNRTDDPTAGGFLNPNTTANAGVAGSEEPPTESSEAAVSAHRNLIAGTMRRIINREVMRVEQACKKPGSFLKAVDDMYQGFANHIAEAIQPIAEALCSVPGVELEVDVMACSRGYVETSRSQLVQASGNCTADNLAATVADVTANWHERAETLADSIIGESQNG